MGLFLICWPWRQCAKAWSEWLFGPPIPEDLSLPLKPEEPKPKLPKRDARGRFCRP